MSRWLRAAWLVAAAVLVVGTGTIRGAGQTDSRVPTFNQQVARIVYENCATCHRPDGIAPMPLLTYEHARPWAQRIKAMVQERTMPPWFADPQVGEFRNDRSLSEADIETLAAWADSGAPQGEGSPPSPPRFQPSGWEMNRAPDLILPLPFGAYELPAAGEVPTFRVWMKLPLRQDRWVEAIQIRPSIPAAVHHSSVSLADDLPPGTRLGRAPVFPGGPVLDGVPVYRDGRPFSTTADSAVARPIMFYVPGGGFMRFPDGIAKRFGRDDWLAWGLHLISPGAPATLQVEIGLWFARQDPHHELQTWTVNQTLLVEGREIAYGPNGLRDMPDIPAGASNWAVTGVLDVEDDITIHALWPHMHYRGKDMRFVVTDPDGNDRTILSVPRYNPHWQLTYELVRPLRVRRGSTITAYGHYDNSAANPHNPDPTVAVRFGEQAVEEMFVPFIEVTVDDEDLRFERMLEQLPLFP